MPGALPDSWTLEGYDLDIGNLESGGPIEILLTIMFPNDGFEWGTRRDVILLEHNRALYSAAP